MQLSTSQTVFKSISVLFHPLIYPTAAAILLFFTDSYFSLFEPKAKIFIIAVVFALTYLAPAFAVYLLYLFRSIDSVTLENRSQRILPLLFTSLVYYSAYYMLKQYQALFFFNIFILASTVSAILAVFISTRWKISLHTIGIGGFLAMLLQQSAIYGTDNFFIFSLVLLLSGVLGTARLSLKSHAPAEVYGGFVVGFASVFAVYTIVF